MTTELMIAYLLKDWTASGSAPHPGDPVLKIIAKMQAAEELSVIALLGFDQAAKNAAERYVKAGEG